MVCALGFRQVWFGALDVTKPYEFIGFGALEVTKPYEFIGRTSLGAAAHPRATVDTLHGMDAMQMLFLQCRALLRPPPAVDPDHELPRGSGGPWDCRGVYLFLLSRNPIANNAVGGTNPSQGSKKPSRYDSYGWAACFPLRLGGGTWAHPCSNFRTGPNCTKLRPGPEVTCLYLSDRPMQRASRSTWLFPTLFAFCASRSPL